MVATKVTNASLCTQYPDGGVLTPAHPAPVHGEPADLNELGSLSAINRNDGTGDEARSARDEKADRGGHFF